MEGWAFIVCSSQPYMYTYVHSDVEGVGLLYSMDLSESWLTIYVRMKY